ncbi:MAG: hypothetical protein KDA61_06220 [Planctomycetales bacterium]|nr:hypothetical protein [Planctomycetales bacterium]
MINPRPSQTRLARLQRQFVAVGGALSLSALLASLAAAGGRTPPPCSVDGVCTPKQDTWGWYQTNWRPWPGEQVRPTPAPPKDETEDIEEGRNIGDIQLPQPSEEALSDPEALEPEATATPDQAPEGAPAGMGEGLGEPLGSPLDAPPAGGNDLPGIDPFGAAPPRLPNVLGSDLQAVAAAVPDAAPAMFEAPVSVTPPPEVVAPTPPVVDLDAPPSLPSSLLRAASARRGQPVAQRAPRSDAFVTQTSANGNSIRLVNPANALSMQPDQSGLQQAVYFEATDEAPQR